MYIYILGYGPDILSLNTSVQTNNKVSTETFYNVFCLSVHSINTKTAKIYSLQQHYSVHGNCF